MGIGAICTRSVVFTGRNDSIADAARLMREHHVGSIVVAERTAAGPKPVGVVTDRDIAVGAVAASLNCDKAPVESVMRTGVTCVRENDGVAHAVELMRSRGVRRLPVVDDRGVLIGLLAADDVVELLAEEMKGLAGMLAHEGHRERMERPLVA